MARAMAKCTCATCGATFAKIEYFRNREAADSYEEWALSNCTECSDCYRERMSREREEANAKAAAESAEMELPELTGSEKQIAWANKIRLDWIETVSARLNPENKYYERDGAFIPYVLTKATEAKTWIDCRESWKLIVEKYQQDYLLEYTTGVTVEEATEEPATVEVTVPENQTHSGCVEISQTDSAVEARYVKDDDFRQLVKGLSYEWDGDKKCWHLKASYKTGNMIDRVAELGSRLLNAGFAVKIANAEAREKAVRGDYEPMPTRWVFYNSKRGLRIEWGGRDEKLYTAARKIKGSKWENGCVSVPVACATEVLDFAEINNFAISAGARKAIDDYLDSIKVIKPADSPTVPETPDKLKEILSSSREVIDDLKD